MPAQSPFWCSNGGIASMTTLSIFPLGMYLRYLNIKHRLWIARSTEIKHDEAFQTWPRSAPEKHGLYRRFINTRYGPWPARAMKAKHGEVLQTLA